MKRILSLFLAFALIICFTPVIPLQANAVEEETTASAGSGYTEDIYDFYRGMEVGSTLAEGVDEIAAMYAADTLNWKYEAHSGVQLERVSYSANTNSMRVISAKEWWLAFRIKAPDEDGQYSIKMTHGAGGYGAQAGSIYVIPGSTPTNKISLVAYKQGATMTTDWFYGEADADTISGRETTTGTVNMKAGEEYIIVFLPTETSALSANAFFWLGQLQVTRIGEYIADNADANVGTCGENLTWTLDDEGTLTISGTGAMYHYSRDDKIYPSWHQYSDSITSVVMEEGVETVGNLAFHWCSNLIDVAIPNSIMFFGDLALPNYTDLNFNIYDNAIYLGNQDNPYLVLVSALTGEIKSCDIHPNTKVIGASAFGGCRGLTEVPIPDGVITIGEHAFYSCFGLTSIVIPDSVINIDDHSFGFCDALTEITIPNSVVNIGSMAFYHCISLADVYYGGTEDHRANIAIGDSNEPLTSATWHYVSPTVCEYMETGKGTATKFATLEEALTTATGGTITLLANATVDTMVLKPGVTLDLNGCTLTADMLIVMSGATVLDGGEDCVGGGKLNIAKEKLLFMRENGQGILPVWNGVDGYVFTKVSFQQLVQTAGEGAAQYIFLPQFSNRNASSLMKNGGSDNGVKIKVCLTWGDGQSQQYYTYSDDLVEKVFDGTGRWVFSLNVTGISGITDMAASAMIVTDTYAQVSATATGLTAG